jgi:TonB-dependent receptor
MKIKTTLFLLYLICPVLSYAANLSGYVRDSETKEPLISATVSIKGTTIGTTTDLNGYFELSVSKEGTYTFVASYIGYEPKEVELSLGKNEKKTYSFLLEVSSYKMEEVVVKIQAKGQIRALNKQFNSDYISNVVSSERLQEVPDATVADALSRIPGITVTSDNGEGDKIRIRGMEPRMNLVTVNGIRAPSADRNENSVGLAGISPFMIEEIEVQKSLTPDKDADVVGGIVDLKLKDADEGFKINSVFQNNYNSLIQSAFNPRATLQLSNRFFDNKLGIVLVGNYEDIDRSSERMDASGRLEEEQKELMITTTGANFWASEFKRKRYGGSLFLDYKLPHGKIKASSFLNGLDNEEYKRTYNYGQGLLIRKNAQIIESNTLSLVSSLQIEYKLPLNSTVDLGASYTSAKNNKPKNFSIGSKLAPWLKDGEKLPAEIEKINRNSSTVYPYDLLKVAQFWSDSSYFMENISSSDNTFDENEMTVFLNWKIPFNFGNQVSGKIKIGGKYRKKNREYDASDRGHGLTAGGQEDLRAYIGSANPNLDFGLNKYPDYIPSNSFSMLHLVDDYDKKILDEQFRMHGYLDQEILEQIVSDLDADHWSAVTTGEHPRRNIADDYSGNEEILAGYAMADVNLTKYVQLIGGVRYEDTKTDYRSFGVKEQGVVDFSFEEFADSLAQRQSTYLMPMVNAKIKPTDWLQFRFAYTQSIARPKYYSYMPRYKFGRLKDITNIGNPDMEPALSNNIDAYVSIKTNNKKMGITGVFSAGVFHKRIEGYEYTKSYVNIHDSINNRHPYNVIASNREARINIPINNPEPAYSKGLEIDWQGSFIYLPKPFNGLVLNANYTLTETEQTQIVQQVKQFTPDPEKPWITETEIFDSTYTEFLFSQPKHIFNASIGYDYKGFSGRLAYTLQTESLVGYFDSGRKYQENDRLSAEKHVFDLSLTQKIAKVKGLQVFFNMSNISSTFNKYEYVRTTFDDGKEYQLLQEYFGRIMIAGLRYSM